MPTNPRPKGLAPWKPKPKTLPRLRQVRKILAEYEAHLPLTSRQIYYRLIAEYGWPKGTQSETRLAYMLGRARRAGVIDWDAIRDDGSVSETPRGWAQDESGFWRLVEHQAQRFELDRAHGQAVTVELWSEAAGLLPMLGQAVGEYGVSVYSSSGYDSTTAKWAAAKRMADGERPTIALHVGDYDAAGEAVYRSTSEDVGQMISDGQAQGRLPRTDFNPVKFERIAVTAAQVREMKLPTALPKPKVPGDGSLPWPDGEPTAQLEAIPPDRLIALVKSAVEARMDMRKLRARLAEEKTTRETITTKLGDLTKQTT